MTKVNLLDMGLLKLKLLLSDLLELNLLKFDLPFFDFFKFNLLNFDLLKFNFLMSNLPKFDLLKFDLPNFDRFAFFLFPSRRDVTEGERSYHLRKLKKVRKEISKISWMKHHSSTNHSGSNTTAPYLNRL